ncbi:MAG: oxidoreductase [Comamonadaceae bacterium CG12_big_fil_rev_8_21_14_0_65_59_15]|nr:MAG: oxidoreductase [Comamonadaceae bacterium CG12_big_fil_rev_8_21_14_0_65_59_15]
MSVLCTVALSASVHAQTLPKPVGPVILTVSGNIGNKNSAQGAEFDAAMMDAMAVSQIKTTTPWRKGVVSFSGPTLKSLLKLVAAHGQTLKMTALDKYEVTVPAADAEQFNPVLARKINGVTLRLRDHGPLFMVYPFDALPALQTDVYYGRSIWHLAKIVVE